MGAGRSRLLHTVMGAQPRTGGQVVLDGQDFHPRHPADAVEAGIGLVPEDRKQQSLVLTHSVRWNATLATLRRISRRGVLTPGAEKAHAAKIVQDLGVRLRTAEQPIGDLSGGNQQKSSSAAGWPRSRASCCWTSRREVWTWAPGWTSTA